MSADRDLLGEIAGRLSGGDWLWTRWWKRFSRMGYLRALSELPAGERLPRGCVVGRARLLGKPLEARFTRTPCIAYWARSHDHTENMTHGRYAAVADFAVDLDDGTSVVVDGRDAIFVVHVKELVTVGTYGGTTHDVATIVSADRVVAWGELDRPREGSPFREALRLRRRGKKPIWVGLASPP